MARVRMVWFGFACGKYFGLVIISFNLYSLFYLVKCVMVVYIHVSGRDEKNILEWIISYAYPFSLCES